MFFQDDVIIREGFVILKRNTERNDMYDFPAKYIGVSGFFLSSYDVEMESLT